MTPLKLALIALLIGILAMFTNPLFFPTFDILAISALALVASCIWGVFRLGKKIGRKETNKEP